jgi:chemotaxis protein MotB
MSAPGGGRRRRHVEEEHENHERWLVSYADMITVLMALFIVLFAISQVDQQKFTELKTGLAQGFGANSSIPVPGGSSLLPDDGQAPNPTRVDTVAAPQPVDLSGQGEGTAATAGQQAGDARAALEAAAAAEVERLEKVKEQLMAALTASGLQDRVRFRITERGLAAAIVADDVFFASASAEIQPTGLRVLDAMAPTLRDLRQEIAVEGHANHLPISNNSVYPTNWELSAARAASVVRRLADNGGVAPTRMGATGFSDTRPLYPTNTPEALAGNRRVDVIILSDQSPQVRALLPGMAEKYEQGG